jgi:FHS family L-fucose permease-like MFS transporter
MWGFITCLNDILIPHLKSLFHLNYAQAMLVQFCFFMAYLIMSLPMSWVLKKLHYKASMAIGMIIAGIGCLIFIPAAYIGSYAFFLLGLFILASGIVLLQVAANPYVTFLGPPLGASSRLTFAQAVNSLAYTIAPFFGAVLILATPILTNQQQSLLNPAALSQYKTAIIHTIQTPYLLLAILFFVVAMVISFYKLPKLEGQLGHIDNSNLQKPNRSIWQYPYLFFGAVAIFLYVGAEVSTGSFIVNYLGLPQIAAMPAQQAAHYVSVYWGGAMIGRFIGAWILKKSIPSLVVVFNAAVATLLLIISVIASGYISMWAILSMGLFNSILFPTIFALAIKDLGDLTSVGSGILCAAIVGGAVVPEVQGILADHIGPQNSFLLLIISYLVILCFGWFSYRRSESCI